MAKALDSVLEWLYPSKCALCEFLGPDAICPVCFSEFRRFDSVVWPGSGALDYQAAAFAYEGRAAQAVQRLKYSRVTSLAARMATLLAEALDDRGLHHVDAVVPVPIHWRRRCMRGFNQSELLSALVPAAKLRPDLLTRIRSTRPQVGLTSEQREKNIQGAFKAHPTVNGKSILLIDDVLTSGQTAQECAKALKQTGAFEVGILAFAGSATIIA